MRSLIVSSLALFAASAGAFGVVTPPSTDSVGPAQQAGAEVDRAMARMKVWLEKAKVDSKAAADEAEVAAKKWLDRTVVDLWGDPKAELVHGMQLARRLSEETTAKGEQVVHYDWTPVELKLEAKDKLPARVVLMLHGLDEPGTGWDDLTPHLLRAGYEVIWFDYPNDGPIAASTDIVGAGLKKLAAAGVREIDIIGHSMGGLVARDLLTREAWYAGDGESRNGLPRVKRLIIMSTPNNGSVLAYLEPLAEAREQISRRVDGTEHAGSGLLNSYTDGSSEAATDLLPGSKFLTDLNARPLPKNVAITNIIAVLFDEKQQECISGRAADFAAWMGVECTPRVGDMLNRLSCTLGDGLVCAESAELEGVTDTVRVSADHRSMVREWKILLDPNAPALTPPEKTPAVPVILERLARE